MILKGNIFLYDLTLVFIKRMKFNNGMVVNSLFVITCNSLNNI